MAEMSESPEKHGGGKKPKAKKHSTRIDMTPMVDLGFLLVTFFIFTTTLSKPTTMDLKMPADKETPDKGPKVNNKEVLVLLLDSNNTIYYYQPTESGIIPDLTPTDFSPKGVRKLLTEKKQDVINMGDITNKDGKKEQREIMVFIKPTDASRYANFIDILDEIAVTEIKKYVVVPPQQPELDKIRSTRGNN